MIGDSGTGGEIYRDEQQCAGGKDKGEEDGNKEKGRCGSKREIMAEEEEDDGGDG